MEKRDVIVIGGGLAGLVTAYELGKRGRKALILEKSSEHGGAMGSLRKDGYILERGPNTIMETSPVVTELVKELGLEGDKIYADESSAIRYVVRDGEMQALPSSPPAFLRSSLFSKRTLLALMKEPFKPAWDNRYEENLAQFVRRRLNQEFLDYAINPFVAGVFAGAPEHISVQHGFKRLYALEQKYGSMIRGMVLGARERKKRAEKSKQNARMFNFRRGLSQLTDALLEQSGAEFRGAVNVTGLERGADGNWLLKDSSGRQYGAGEVYFCGNLHSLTGMEGGLLEEVEKAVLGEVYHPPVTVLSLGFRREDVRHSLKGFGVLVPEVEKFNILGALFNSSLFPGRAPEGHVLLTVFIGGTRQPEMTRKSEEQVLKLALADLDRLIGLAGAPVFEHFRHWEKAIPQYDVGYGRVKEIFAELEKRHGGLHFSGNYRDGISAADTIVEARGE